jgi:hypothetical protein
MVVIPVAKKQGFPLQGLFINVLTKKIPPTLQSEGIHILITHED